MTVRNIMRFQGGTYTQLKAKIVEITMTTKDSAVSGATKQGIRWCYNRRVDGFWRILWNQHEKGADFMMTIRLFEEFYFGKG